MRRRKKPAKVIQNIFQEVFKLARTITKGLVQWVLRSLMVLGRRRSPRLSQAGFVLPTVVMVSLVAILLTTAILFRSFDRSKNASNYRVNEAVLTAATPALDRARAKLDALFADPRLPRSTPSDNALYDAFVSDQYTFGDETRLKLVNPDVGTPTTTDTVRTAWKYPVDTDNDGLFDSFTLYGIYFRNPPRNTTNATQFARGRRPVEARNLPMNEGSSQICAGATNVSSSSVSGADWFQINGQLKKAFFVYTATVPIDDAYIAAAGLPAAQYKAHTGGKGFSALEMQQDRLRVPLNNNAVWFQDDVEISGATDFALNGRVHTNGNLLVSGLDNNNRVRFYQVSSPASCFYTAENSKIVVAGNVATGDVRRTTNGSNVEVHLFQGQAVAGDANTPAGVGDIGEGINTNNKTTTAAGGATVAYYTEAYNQRLRVLVDGAMYLHDQNAGFNPTAPAPNPRPEPTTGTVSNAANRFPKDVRDKFINNYQAATARQDLEKVLETYFRDQTRRVPYAEVPYPNAAQALEIGGTARSSDPASANFVFAGTTGDLMPPNEWKLIADPTSGSPNNYTNLPLDPDGLRATDPFEVQDNNNIENNLGDRILVGNNLPFVNKEPEAVKDGANAVYWNENDLYTTDVTGTPRTRESRVENLDDLGDTSRGGYWEQAAAKAGALAAEQAAGGLRVVTGAGVYIDGAAKPTGTGVRGTDSFLPSPPTVAELTARGITVPAGTTDANIVWPDTMPMWRAEDVNLDGLIGLGEGRKGDLQMRATAVYHYATSADTAQLPIACVSSYYDPTSTDPAPYTPVNAEAEPNARSNNGKVYSVPFVTDRATVVTGTYGARLTNQAKMIFPNGRLANPTLAQAVTKLGAGQALNLAENAAIDATMCALAIDDGTAAPSTAIPAYAIRERTFLDGRQVQALHRLTLDTAVSPPTPVAIPVNTVLPNYTGVTPIPGDVTDPNKLKITDTNAQLKTSYDLPLEQRQPLEIRVTEIDIAALKGQTIGAATDTSNTSTNNQEYLIPNSGIIYATRDDALPDTSSITDDPADPNDVADPNNPSTGQLGVSATDYKLDPTRRPNGIRLINGSDLSRTNFFRLAEKGFILASNLPVYIKGDFNLHKAPGAGGAERQEFTTLLTPLPGNFYTRGTNALAPGGNRGLNPNFACRQGQTATCTEGDQWRAASILSDAITLLSTTFVDGFRNQGDYDLRNNAGNTAVETRLNNGFWSNSFVTSAPWWGNAAGPTPYPRDNTIDSHVGSYLLNGVTPIQRRTNFPVYQMEVCRKLLVSECGPSDWRQSHIRTIAPGRTVQVNAGTTAGLPEEIIPVGSTATLPADADPNLNRYPRRVAFNRDTDGYGLLIPQPGLTFNPSSPASPANNPTATPYGMVGTTPTLIPYAAGGPTVTSAANALWFLTTATATNPSPATPSTNAGRLYYLPFDPETVSERQLILPGTPQFPNIPTLANNAAFVAANTLNSPLVITGTGDTDPSDYAVCITGGTASQAYNATSAATPCPATTSAAIEAARAALAGLVTDDVTSVTPWDGVTTTTPLTATKKVNVYELPATGIIGDPTPAPITLTLSKGSQLDPIFVFRMPAGITTPMTFGAGGTVTLALDGVNPNNIFWVSNGGMTITDVGHKLVGNFLGSNAGASPLTIGATPRIPAGRFLGFTGVTGSLTGGVLTAMTTTNEPLLVPMLQIHSPEGTPAGAPFFGAINEEWLQQAASTRYNAALIMGDTPSRPEAAPTGAETGGGLANFPRFLESWETSEAAVPSDRTVTINGSFIQFQKSNFATAPIQHINPDATDTSLFYDTNAYLTGNGFITNVPAGTGVYRYPGGAFARVASFYRAPTRQWGFDVGLLSQLPDLFSQRFSAPPASRPNEFFREVGRDDAWIQTLLCAGQKPTPTATTYDSPAVPATALPPGGCPAVPDASVGG